MAAGEHELPTVYDPRNVERRIYERWEQSGYFRAGRHPERPPFSIVMPPPNVTGVLHLGHALDNTLQDITIRYKRLNGFDALWVPGTDHAGIATQTRVEKTLQESEGKSRHDLGREAFVERVWAWKHQYGDAITRQIRALGSSCDWSRERFTMDEGLSGAVREVFVRLYEKGLIYRGHRIINWCPRCSTALSDIEVEHKDQTGHLYHIRYRLADGSGEVVIATTRPETMFADVAVAVHPEDARYEDMVGKTVRLPLTDREIPVIADDYVDKEYGTGCLKITPAHDPNDFEVGERHHLEQLQCIDADGRLNALAGEFQGLTREEARRAVVAALEAGGHLVRTEDIDHAVGHCSRCDTVVEPFLSDQWFVRMDQLARPALESVAREELDFVPARFSKVFVHWLENVRDWCISRQLWWGHRIPAWYCDDCGELSVSKVDLDCCPHCDSSNIRQDEDVLDTWFSSALWPFSTLDWPDLQSPDFQRYYPTSALMTGYDILFFWVARMVFMGMEFTGKMPFQTVVLHGLVRDAEGQKMSKSKGNGVDPIEVIDQYGADALRFMLATSTSPGNDQRFTWDKIEGARNFINKIWNASRFVLMNLEGDFQPTDLSEAQLDVADRWILHRLSETVRTVTHHLDEYDFGEAARAMYDFAWDDFCDWYIEFSKLALYGTDEDRKVVARTVLHRVLTSLLTLLHPYIPFVTEEIWQALPNTSEALIVETWPISQTEFVDEAAVSQMQLVMDAIRAVRNVRAELQVAPSKPVSMHIRCESGDDVQLFESVRHYIARFCNSDALTIVAGGEAPEKSLTQVVTGAVIHIPQAGLIDVEAEIARLSKEKARLQGEVDRIEKKLANAGFVAKAPEAVVAKEREKMQDYQMKLQVVQDRISDLQK
ncbi:valine--tRNA ligase [Alicyclobacillus fastidiosus]|uniref:Valine--tRNA ligase n=1 Tax=Alicyclobacillus fastidiosus TaxID=392011 RepID=A0ABV5AFQ9_9BACL|nr:valine--tRNA ligase [Alicyclobacillus fastidiosus]WEH11666.1 valine--tRNA ligase [Alicyclobacillus fastidiosus]